MKRKKYKSAQPIDTDELCEYGCGQIAKYSNGAGKLTCELSSTKCPEIRRKNSEAVKLAYDEGRLSCKDRYSGYSEETKKAMNWNKGLTKSDDDRIASGFHGKNFAGCKHTQESKDKISKFRAEWLKIPENRKNYGRGKKSWMELCFEKWMLENYIEGWVDEFHFWNPIERKNYYVDYIFTNKKLILELDGTQHRLTIEQDRIRDIYLNSLGYKVIRIPHEDFKRRYFSNIGFKDLFE